jgi:hypothetical protein
MPYRIQQPFDELQLLIQELGIYDSPALFYLSEMVQPVSVVDSRINFITQSAPIIPALRSSAGELTNPAANTRLADTGQLPAGDYYVQMFLSGSTLATGYVRLKQRNAADAADVNTLMVRYNMSPVTYDAVFVYTLAQNERLVIENSIAVGAGIEVQGILWTKLL